MNHETGHFNTQNLRMYGWGSEERTLMKFNLN